MEIVSCNCVLDIYMQPWCLGKNARIHILKLQYPQVLHARFSIFPEDVIAYIRQTVEEERERNAESRAALEAELMETRRSSEHLSQLAAVRAQLQNAATTERPVSYYMYRYKASPYGSC